MKWNKIIILKFYKNIIFFKTFVLLILTLLDDNKSFTISVFSFSIAAVNGLVWKKLGN